MLSSGWNANFICTHYTVHSKCAVKYTILVSLSLFLSSLGNERQHGTEDGPSKMSRLPCIHTHIFKAMTTYSVAFLMTSESIWLRNQNSVLESYVLTVYSHFLCIQSIKRNNVKNGSSYCFSSLPIVSFRFVSHQIKPNQSNWKFFVGSLATEWNSEHFIFLKRLLIYS